MADDFRDLFRNWKPGDGDEGDGGEDAEPENRQPRALREKEVRVLGLWATQDPEKPNAPIRNAFILLRDNRGRKVPIVIGPFETMAIQQALDGAASERPATHDLLRNVIDRLGGKIERIVIDDLWQGTFYAKISITLAAGDVMDIDSRPSDAIALAVRVRAPIYVAEDVLEQASRDEE